MSRPSKIIKTILLTLGGILLLTVAGITVLTCVMTPSRLTSLLNSEASKYTRADVTSHNVRFTFWSTFPRFCINIDSLRIDSRALDNLPDTLLAQLPADSRYLASTGAIRGSLNIASLMRGRIVLRDVEVENIDVNLVAANDTAANYNIVPSGGGEMQLPYMTVNKVSLLTPRSLRYYSHPSATGAEIKLDTMSLDRLSRKDNLYKLALVGNIDARSGNLNLLHHFPFSLSGDLKVGFDPLKVSTSDYIVKLGNTTGRMDLSLNMAGAGKLDKFSYRLDDFSLLRLLNYLPGEYRTYLGSFTADIIVNASAHLTSPYHFDSEALPSLEVDFSVPDGNISYRDSMTDLSLRHVGMKARLVYNGEHPSESYFEIPRFNISGPGIDVDVEGLVSDLTTEPTVDTRVIGQGNLSMLGRTLALLKPYSLKGEFDADTHIRFNISQLNGGSLSDVVATGNILLSGISMSVPQSGMKVRADSLDIDFGGDAGELNSNDISNSLFDLKLGSNLITLSNRHNRISLRGLAIKSRVADSTQFVYGDWSRLMPLKVDARLGNLTVAQPDSAEAAVTGIKVSGDVMASPAASRDRKFDLKATADKMVYKHRQDEMIAEKAALDVVVTNTGKPVRSPLFVMPSLWLTDSANLARVPHTDRFITVPANPKLKDFISRWKVGLNFRLLRGELRTPAFAAHPTVSDLNIGASFDSVELRHIALRSLQSSVVLRGGVGNLRQFLTNPTPAPLYLNLDVALDTAQLNQLARAYEEGVAMTKGPDAIKVREAPAPVSAKDTVTMLLPRNLVADIHATARHTRYMNLHLYDLDTHLSMKDGALHVDTLGIDADFGHATLKFDYNTDNVERMGMNVNLGLLDFSIEKFFRNFPSVVAMWPEMTNLSGMLAARCQGNMLLYPNMYVNVPSLQADMELNGTHLKLHQSKFIHRITRMLLIPYVSNIEIANMAVRARVADNLLEVYPFDFEFDRYKLRLGGVNNFNGNLYYHIGVEKSPLHFGFGINIEGLFSNPKLRFGGAKFSEERASEITPQIGATDTLNVMVELSYYLQKLIHKAATSPE